MVPLPWWKHFIWLGHWRDQASWRECRAQLDEEGQDFVGDFDGKISEAVDCAGDVSSDGGHKVDDLLFECKQGRV